MNEMGLKQELEQELEQKLELEQGKGLNLVQETERNREKLNREKLFHRDFLLVVIGQIISLFGNVTLRFALPFYVLDQTGSATAFGTISAVALLPTILFSPLGGVLADRINRRNIMAALDFLTAGVTIAFGIALSIEGGAIVKIAVIMILLSLIQSFYQPAVNSSIPLLSSEKNLVQSNAVVNQVSALANLLGPVIGGILYGVWGLTPIIIVGAVSFFFSAVMELFIHMPFARQEQGENALAVIRQDLGVSVRFITKEKPVMVPVIGIVCLFNLFLSSMLIVGMPFLIKVVLGLNGQWYGLAQGLSGLGAIIGGFLAGPISARLSIRKFHLVLLSVALAVLPMSGAVLLVGRPMIAYVLIVLCCMVGMALASVFTIYMLSFIQKETPEQLLGKVIAFVMTLSMCSQPVGQALYGILFDGFSAHAWVVVLLGAIASGAVALGSKRVFGRL